MRYFKTYKEPNAERTEISYAEAVDLVLRYYSDDALDALDCPGIVNCMFSYLEIEEEE